MISKEEKQAFDRMRETMGKIESLSAVHVGKNVGVLRPAAIGMVAWATEMLVLAFGIGPGQPL